MYPYTFPCFRAFLFHFQSLSILGNPDNRRADSCAKLQGFIVDINPCSSRISVPEEWRIEGEIGGFLQKTHQVSREKEGKYDEIGDVRGRIIT